MKTSVWTLFAFILAALSPLDAADLKEATFTEVINQVSVTEAPGAQARPATVQSRFVAPQILRTGAASRAELTAPDKTITRVGANTIFSFKSGRTLNLQKGSVLFNAPPGQGGGTIQTAAATASVLGTTIIVSFDPQNGCKLLVLEGKARITLPNGINTIVQQGQMIVIPVGATTLPTAHGFDLRKATSHALLLTGFPDPIPSLDKIIAAIEEQEKQINRGELTVVSSDIDPFLIDPNTQQSHLLQRQQQLTPPPPPPTPQTSNMP